jgi:predicted dienelactone hydrolase
MSIIRPIIAAWGAWVMLASISAAQDIALPAPAGPYAVGYGAVTFETEADDTLTRRKGDKRKLLLEIWRPVEAGGAVKSYSTPFISSSLSEDFPFPEGFADAIAVSSRVDAPLAEGEFPVILFSHGLSWPVSLYQSLTEDLASRGYLVIGVNHPHGAAVDFGSGETRSRDAWPDISDEEKRQLMLSEQADFWANDLKAVADALKANPQKISTRYLAGADMQRIGLFGHSLGGTAAGRATDHPAISAVAAMEGNARTPEGEARNVEKPFLHLIGG